MQRFSGRQATGWCGFAGALGALIAVSALTGCPGTLDPDLARMATSTGGSTGSGGSGSGGNSNTGGNDNTGGNGSGGNTGSGGGTVSCTGSLDGATIVTNNCATSLCHDSSGASFSGGLDLTVDGNIGSRLVGVNVTGNDYSECGGNSEPYLTPGSNPATGLLIDKTKSTYPCGSRMPLTGLALNTNQTTCLIQWATTLTSP